MVCVSVSGDSVIPLYIVKGISIPYRKYEISYGSFLTEFASYLLPEDSVFLHAQIVVGLMENIY